MEKEIVVDLVWRNDRVHTRILLSQSRKFDRNKDPRGANSKIESMLA